MFPETFFTPKPPKKPSETCRTLITEKSITLRPGQNHIIGDKVIVIECVFDDEVEVNICKEIYSPNENYQEELEKYNKEYKQYEKNLASYNEYKRQEEEAIRAKNKKLEILKFIELTEKYNGQDINELVKQLG